MNSYSLLIFVHVLAATGLFVAMAIEGVSLGRLSQARTSEEAQESLRSLALPARVGPIAMLTAVASGVWMMAVAWSDEPWMRSALGAVIAMGAVGGIVTNRRVRQLRTVLAAGGSHVDVARRTSMRALAASLRVRVALGVGILALMTLKPGLAGSLLIVAASAAGGLLLAGIPSPRRESAIGEPTRT
jgi:hypothetical protein